MKKNNQLNHNGAVLLTVIILSMVLTFIVISIMSTSVSHVKTSQVVIDDTKAEYLGQSYFYQYHQHMMNAQTSNLPENYTEQIGLKQFTADSDVLLNTLTNTNEVILSIYY